MIKMRRILGLIRWRMVDFCVLNIKYSFYQKSSGSLSDKIFKWLFAKINTEKFQVSNQEVLIQFDRSQVLMTASQNSILEREIARNGNFYLVEFAEPLISDGSVCLDIGANAGVFSVPLARRRPQIEIYGLEPHPQMIERFKANIRSNRLTNLHALNLAASDNNDPMDLFSQDFSQSDNWGLSSTVYASTIGPHQKIEVACTTCDQLKQEKFPDKKVDFIKIDVQGAELGVLCGAIGILKSDRPIVVFEHEDEFFDNPASIKTQIRALFDSEGYRVFVLSKRFPKMYFPVNWDVELSVDLIAIPSLY